MGWKKIKPELWKIRYKIRVKISIKITATNQSDKKLIYFLSRVIFILIQLFFGWIKLLPDSSHTFFDEIALRVGLDKRRASESERVAAALMNVIAFSSYLSRAAHPSCKTSFISAALTPPGPHTPSRPISALTHVWCWSTRAVHRGARYLEADVSHCVWCPKTCQPHFAFFELLPRLNARFVFWHANTGLVE